MLEIDGREWGRAEYQYYDGINVVTYEYYDRASPFYACYISLISDTGSYAEYISDFEDIFDSFEFT